MGKDRSVGSGALWGGVIFAKSWIGRTVMREGTCSLVYAVAICKIDHVLVTRSTKLSLGIQRVRALVVARPYITT